MSENKELRPVCFMVMPFRKKKVSGPTGENAPTEINCDALWDKAYRPAIEAAGYTPIRADLDTGSVIVKDMLERLAFADLVVADVSLPNGNVYYEIGLRHVAKETGCILFAADWSRQLFDIDQFTSVRYTLTDGEVPAVEAEAICTMVTAAVSSLKDSPTPWHEFIPGSDDRDRRGVFRKFAEQLSVFQADIRAARLTAGKQAKRERIKTICEKLPPSALQIADVATELLILVRDEIGWQETLEFTDSLPEAILKIPLVQEQRLLALANLGQPEEAIARLEELMKSHGETPERLGIIGGRYKRLWRAARESRLSDGKESASGEERRCLERAIDYYTRGMQLDYNQYYCSCNIAELLLTRQDEGDADKAIIIDHFVIAACERAIERGEDDDWTRPTLLGAGFRSGDVSKVKELAKRIEIDGISTWKLESTIEDIGSTVQRTMKSKDGHRLSDIYNDLKELLTEDLG